MRHFLTLSATASLILLTACAKTGTNPQDPYESYNRRTFRFNQGFDTVVLKPASIAYRSLLPDPIRAGVNNFYDNLNMIPTVANDILQAEWNYAIKDSWRFAVNSSLGIGGILDVAGAFNLPPHSNDLGITFAKWGDMNSPYFVIPFLGPSTFRDGMGLMFNYTFLTPYPYLSTTLNYSLMGVRYVDLRSQMLDNEKLMDEALDRYTFMRDAYLQHRNYLITGTQPSDSESSTLYVSDDQEHPSPLLQEEPENGTPSPAPITTALHATHRTASA